MVSFSRNHSLYFGGTSIFKQLSENYWLAYFYDPSDIQNFELLQFLPDTLPVRQLEFVIAIVFPRREKRYALQCQGFAMSEVYYLGRWGDESLLQEN